MSENVRLARQVRAMWRDVRRLRVESVVRLGACGEHLDLMLKLYGVVRALDDLAEAIYNLSYASVGWDFSGAVLSDEVDSHSVAEITNLLDKLSKGWEEKDDTGADATAPRKRPMRGKPIHVGI